MKGNKMNVRQAAVSGSFYSAFASDLSTQIDRLFASVKHVLPRKPPKILIVPHAGYMYSGQVAAEAYDALIPFKDQYKRVVLLGPSHNVPLCGIALPNDAVFETPLGQVMVGVKAFDQVLDLPSVCLSQKAHEQEHSLEVQLPFLQKVLEDFEVIPMVVGDTHFSEVRDVLERLWGGSETLIVVSTDLSHFLCYYDAKRVDAHTISKIHDFKSTIRSNEACGHFPLNGALALAKERNMTINKAKHCNSGDSTGSRDRVVGYASFALFEDDAA